MEIVSEDKQVRVILWCIHRTISTAFEKSMGNLDHVQIIHEPYFSVYNYGPDKRELPDYMQKEDDTFYDLARSVQMDYTSSWDSETATYRYLKESILEAEYPDKKVVFVKDMSYGVPDKLDMLPKGYRHAFLIRNPVKVFTSWKRLLNKYRNKTVGDELAMDPTKNGYVPVNYGFGESFQIYEHVVKTGIEPNPVVIDSDDVQNNPESIMRQFCDRIGIQFTDKLINWNAGDGFLQGWKGSRIFIKGNHVFEYYKQAFDCTTFHKPTPEPNRADLDDDVNICIDASLPYYKKLYSHRLIP